MRRILLALTFILATPYAAFADDLAVGQIIVGNGDVLRGHFHEERHLKGFNAPLNSEGHFVVAPGHGLIWAIEKPFPTASVITPAGLAQDVNGVKVMQLPAQKMPFLLHLYDMLGGALAGHWETLKTDFIVTHSGDTESWQVKLSPRKANNPAMPFHSITIKGSRFVEHVLLLKPDGDSDVLTFFDETVSSSPPVAAEAAAFASVLP